MGRHVLLPAGLLLDEGHTLWRSQPQLLGMQQSLKHGKASGRCDYRPPPASHDSSHSHFPAAVFCSGSWRPAGCTPTESAACPHPSRSKLKSA